jgi:hypothetical protein
VEQTVELQIQVPDVFLSTSNMLGSELEELGNI